MGRASGPGRDTVDGQEYVAHRANAGPSKKAPGQKISSCLIIVNQESAIIRETITNRETLVELKNAAEQHAAEQQNSAEQKVSD